MRPEESLLWALRRSLARLPGVRGAYHASRRARFAAAFGASCLRERFFVPPEPRPAERLTAILLSFARPKNIQRIADALTRCDLVERVIISNNNPAIRLEPYLRLDSSRVTLVNQAARARPIKRWDIAREVDAKYFLALDDDVYLHARQIEALFRGLVAAPETPRGVVGQVLVRPATSAPILDYRVVHGRTARVDVLNRVYLFTASHRGRVFELLEEVYRRAPELRPLPFGDDIVLSFAARVRPIIQDVGGLLFYPSGDNPAAARWNEPGFQECRARIYRELMDIAPRDDDPPCPR